uniref:26S proteasome complex subunit SEM1 n=1 Tax=Neovison vison TaxID=452646 RepID=A0A8C7ELD4_NEOVI
MSLLNMQLVALGLQEEDCKFREFPDEGWSGLNEDEEANLWEDNPDDDNVECNFSSQFGDRGCLSVAELPSIRAGKSAAQEWVLSSGLP